MRLDASPVWSVALTPSVDLFGVTRMAIRIQDQTTLVDHCHLQKKEARSVPAFKKKRDRSKAQLHVCVLDLVGLNTQVIQCLPLRRMIEHNHEFWDGRIQLDSLMVAEGLPQGMTAVVAGEVDGLAPCLYEAIDGLNSEDSSLTLEQTVLVFQGPPLRRPQPILYALDSRFIQSDPATLPGLLLLQDKLFTGLQVSHLPDSNR